MTAPAHDVARDRWADLPAVLGASLGMLLTGLGLSSVVSARFVYPVPLPGQSPFGVRTTLNAFNGKTKVGRPAVLVHAYTTDPPVAFVIPDVSPMMRTVRVPAAMRHPSGGEPAANRAMSGACTRYSLTSRSVRVGRMTSCQAGHAQSRPCRRITRLGRSRSCTVRTTTVVLAHAH